MPDVKYPNSEYLYYRCAKEFGWTIEETQNQPAYYLTWIVGISNALGGMNDREQHSRSNESGFEAN